MQRLDSPAERNRNLIGEIESQLSKNLENNGLPAHVYGRRKQPFSIWTKMSASRSASSNCPTSSVSAW